MDSAIYVYPLNNRNRARLGGCLFIGTDKAETQKANVFIFNNPYLKTNIDIVFMGGKLFISDSYGENMERSTIYYIPHGGRC